MLKIENVTGGYINIPVLKNISFEVGDGELVGLIGLNGAGKSTTMKMLTGLLKPTSGEIELAADLKIGMVFQESVLDEELTVLDNLKSRQALYRKQDKAWLEKLIQLTGLDAFLN